LGVPYIKSICIKGKEYTNIDYDPSYNPCNEIDLGVPYIKSIKIRGKEYKNTSYIDTNHNNIGNYINNCNFGNEKYTKADKRDESKQ